MLNLNQKIKYFTSSALRILEPKICPFCKSTNSKIIDRKYLVTTLIECTDCNLKYRHPYELESTNKEFYQKDYAESDLLTTDLPNANDLNNFISTNFTIDENKNVQRVIDIIEILTNDVANISMIDYGCSWGYMSYQFKQKVKKIQSFEISLPRATYGNKNLNLNIVSNEQELQPQVDVFFSSHVIEHVPSLQNFISLAKKLVKPGGYIITFCPNGSDEFQKSNPKAFHHIWGKVHPNYIGANFFKKAFNGHNMYLSSTPINFDSIKNWDKNSCKIEDLSQVELLSIIKV